jgi:quercetin dioxygenase-like cupin family protein
VAIALPKTILAVLAGIVAGAGGMAVVLAGADPDARPLRQTATPLENVPEDNVTAIVETVRLDGGFVSTHRHGGPTINLVRSGLVEISARGTARRHGGGESFVEPGGRVHTVTVVEDTVIDVVRILPPGAEATTEVPDAAR